MMYFSASGNSAATDPFDIDSSGIRSESPFEEDQDAKVPMENPRIRESSDEKSDVNSINSGGFEFTELEG